MGSVPPFHAAVERYFGLTDGIASYIDDLREVYGVSHLLTVSEAFVNTLKRVHRYGFGLASGAISSRKIARRFGA